MKKLLKILDISNTDIGRQTGLTRQAVHISLKRGSGPAYDVARVLINTARLNPAKMANAREIYAELEGFLNEEIF